MSATHGMLSLCAVGLKNGLGELKTWYYSSCGPNLSTAGIGRYCPDFGRCLQASSWLRANTLTLYCILWKEQGFHVYFEMVCWSLDLLLVRDRTYSFLSDNCMTFQCFNSDLFLNVGSLSEEGLLVYLRVLQIFLSQLPVSASGADCQDSPNDSEDEDEEISKMTAMTVSFKMVVEKFEGRNTQVGLGFLCVHLFLTAPYICNRPLALCLPWSRSAVDRFPCICGEG